MRTIIATLALCGLTACATPLKNMETGQISGLTMAADSPLRNALNVGDVTGGKEAGKFKVFATIEEGLLPNDDLEAAIRDSLAANGLLAAGMGDYVVDAELLDIKIPFAAINVKVATSMRYKVNHEKSGEIMFDEIITKEHTTDFGEAWLADKRMRLSTQAAIKANIGEFIKKLSSMMMERETEQGIQISYDYVPAERAYMP